MLIGHIRVMFDVKGQWSKYGEDHLLTIKNMLAFFQHIVSRNWVLDCVMLTVELSGF